MEDRDAILFLGETGVGKTTLCKVLAQCKDVYSEKEGAVFVFKDGAKAIGSTPESTTRVVAPFLSECQQVAYLDCPGFGDDRGFEVELNSMLMVREAALRLATLKVAFVVEFHNVVGGARIRAFKGLLEYATKLLVDIGPYLEAGAVGIVCTKCNNEPDKNLRESVRIYLGKVHTKLREELSKDKASEDCIRLVRYLLENYEDKVGLLRSPNEETTNILESPTMQSERVALDEMLRNNLGTVKVTHMGFPLSLGAERLLLTRLDRLRRDICVVSIQDAVKGHFSGLISQGAIDESRDKITEHEECLLAGPFLEYDQHALQQELCPECAAIPHVLFRFECLRELMRLDGATRRDTLSKVRDCMKEVRDFVGKEDCSIRHFFLLWKQYFDFSIALSELLWSYEVQKERWKFDVADVTRWGDVSNGRAKRGIHITPKNDRLFLQTLSSRGLRIGIELLGSEMVPKMHDWVNQLLRESLRHTTNVKVSSQHVVQVTGVCVVLSEVLSDVLSAAKRKVRRINVFAKYAIFVDCDLDAVGLQWKLAMVAPLWYVTREVKFNLNGAHGLHPRLAAAEKGAGFDTRSRNVDGKLQEYRKRIGDLEIEQQRVKKKRDKELQEIQKSDKDQGAGQSIKIAISKTYHQAIKIFSSLDDTPLQNPSNKLQELEELLQELVQKTPVLKGRNGGQGSHGLPGDPGGPGGSFFCGGCQIKHGSKLTVSVCGGDGSSGQPGGDGGDGEGGVDAIPGYFADDEYHTLSEAESTVAVVVNKRSRTWYGHDGGLGGAGGDGGCGGHGGRAGKVIILIPPSVRSNIKVDKNDGQKGKDGQGGRPGKGGLKGTNYVGDLYFLTFLPVWPSYTPLKQSVQALEQAYGRDGAHTEGMITPQTADIFSANELNTLLLDCVSAMNILRIAPGCMRSDWNVSAKRYWETIESECRSAKTPLFHFEGLGAYQRWAAAVSM